MAVIKCKMCGGDIEISLDKTFGTCEYCGSSMTFPKVSDDQRAALFNRGNHFRRQGEFDKALSVYENIVREDDTDAEAHWCCALCRFGIEYVEDPATLEYIPTCHRASFDSFLEDVDYLAALNYSDGITKRQYQKDAMRIADVQRGILATSQNEEPFDVFICYKETDENGERTRDSLMAQDIYYQLTEQGLRVFFARITLEDKVGAEYEPYIFAALHSAKVMVAVGTTPEHFNAVWVKNEWSRFIALMKKDRSKLLIPCYRDMDPYDLPEQLSVLQSYDMSKIGFIQDLIHGIQKVTVAGNKKAEPEKIVVKESVSGNTASLLERAWIFAEDKNWDDANTYFDRVLDEEPKCSEAYLGKCCVSRQASKFEDLFLYDGSADPTKAFLENPDFEKAMRFGTEEEKKKLTGLLDSLREQKAEKYYQSALQRFEKASFSKEMDNIKKSFLELGSYRDAAAWAEKCDEKKLDLRYREAQEGLDKAVNTNDTDRAAASFRALGDYRDAAEKVKEAVEKGKEIEYAIAMQYLEKAETIDSCKYAAERFTALGDYKDAPEKAVQAEELAEKKKQEKEKALKKKKTIKIIVITVLAVVVLIIILAKMVIIPAHKLKQHKILLQNAQVGDIVLWGAYEQDGDTSNGKEEIEWKILDKQNGKFLVISKYALDCQPYNTEEKGTTWEKCTLRKWLNNDFLNAAFTTEEQKMIPAVAVSADKTLDYDTDFEKATQDQIFLLSNPEVKQYFPSDEFRVCKPTSYSVENGAKFKLNKDSYSCNWWLRSTGFEQSYAAYIYDLGGIINRGSLVNQDDYAVRPAMWIDISE